MTAQPPIVVKATLTALPKGEPLTVHFNPASLVYSVENANAQQSGGPSKVQYVAQFSGKLSMDLQFDTTSTGTDVRIFTNQVAQFMVPSQAATAAAASAPPPAAGGAQPSPAKAPPVLQFKWGTYTFQGIMDSFKETIDFFSADGVALRALVSIGLSRQDKVFDEGANLSSKSTAGTLVPSSTSDSLLALATRGGDPSAMRILGTVNGLASLRFTGGASIQVGADVQLNPPAAFVTPPSASLGISAGLAAGISTGAGVSAGAGISVSAGVSSSLGPVYGGAASAGVLATAGAFNGLQTGTATRSTTANLNPLAMLPATNSADVATFGGASFSLGGAANNNGSSGLSANVGAKFSFSDRLTFSSDN
jgi:hypothetical protein